MIRDLCYWVAGNSIFLLLWLSWNYTLECKTVSINWLKLVVNNNININSVSEKKCANLFYAVLDKYEPISIKIGWHFVQGTLNKTMQKTPTSLEICASTTLGNLKWQIEPSMQYLHVHFNESLNSYETTGSYYLWKHQTCSKSHHLYILCSKCLPPARMYARRCWCHVAKCTFNKQCDSDRSVVLVRHLSSSTSEILVCAGGGHFEHVL